MLNNGRLTISIALTMWYHSEGGEEKAVSRSCFPSVSAHHWQCHAQRQWRSLVAGLRCEEEKTEEALCWQEPRLTHCTMRHCVVKAATPTTPNYRYMLIFAEELISRPCTKNYVMSDDADILHLLSASYNTCCLDNFNVRHGWCSTCHCHTSCTPYTVT